MMLAECICQYEMYYSSMIKMELDIDKNYIRKKGISFWIHFELFNCWEAGYRYQYIADIVTFIKIPVIPTSDFDNQYPQLI